MQRITYVFILSFSLLFFLQSSLDVKAQQSTPPSDTIKMVPSSFADLAEKLSPAVVNISSTQKSVVPQDFPELPQFPEGSPFQDFFEEFMDRRGGGAPIPPAASLGSGFIIDAEQGYVITNNHVVRDAETVQVTLIDDTILEAEIIGTDEKTDIAVLKVDLKGHKLTDVEFGDSDALRVGDWTLAIGNPFGLGGSVTAGILSARARNINAGPYDDFLQTDASINRGNSGGPLFDLNGKVIGINTAIFSPTGGSVGIGFAIPSDLAKPVISQIIKYGRTRRGWLGVRIQTVTEEIAESLGLDEPKGALIASVTADGPAQAGGLKAGDIILELNSQKIKDMRSLPRIVAEHEIGSTAKVKYWRDGKESKADVVIGELEKAEEQGLLNTTAKSTAAETTIDTVGLKVRPLTPALREQYAIDSAIDGLFVAGTVPQSEAEKKGLMAGNVIVEVNQQPIKTVEELQDIIEKAQKNARKSVLLLVNDQGNVKFVALRLGPQ